MNVAIKRVVNAFKVSLSKHCDLLHIKPSHKTSFADTPLRLLHLLSWAVCLAGMFLIIAGHAHYTFDIVVAFIVSFLYHYYYHVVVNNISYDNNDENAENTQDFFPDELRVLIKKYGQMNMNVIINEKQTHKNGLTKSNELYEDDYKKSEKEATHGYLYPSLSQSQSKTEHATTHDKYLLTAPPQKILVSARYQKNHVEENFLTFHFEHNARPKSVFRRLCFTSNKSSVLIPFFIFERVSCFCNGNINIGSLSIKKFYSTKYCN